MYIDIDMYTVYMYMHMMNTCNMFFASLPIRWMQPGVSADNPGIRLQLARPISFWSPVRHRLRSAMPSGELQCSWPDRNTLLNGGVMGKSPTTWREKHPWKWTWLFLIVRSSLKGASFRLLCLLVGWWASGVPWLVSFRLALRVNWLRATTTWETCNSQMGFQNLQLQKSSKLPWLIINHHGR